jgi:hypothetical protein
VNKTINSNLKYRFSSKIPKSCANSFCQLDILSKLFSMKITELRKYQIGKLPQGMGVTLNYSLGIFSFLTWLMKRQFDEIT